MSGERILNNSTIRDVISSLHKRDHFVANVLDLMRKAEREQGPSVARLGVTGAGIMPNVRIDAADGSWTRGGFDGVTFKPFGDMGSKETNWSTRSMTYDEVEMLLRELRKFKPKTA